MPLTDQPVKGMYIKDGSKIYYLIDRKLKTQGRQAGLVIMTLKALDTGRHTEKTVKAGVKVEYIEPETIEVQYLYSDNSTYYFMDTKTYENFPIKEEIVGEYRNFLREGDKCLVMKYEGRVINLKGNATVDLKVTEASPAVRGNTANSATKKVSVETGYTLSVPLFIEQGDLITINTETGEYSGRAN